MMRPGRFTRRSFPVRHDIPVVCTCQRAVSRRSFYSSGTKNDPEALDRYK